MKIQEWTENNGSSALTKSMFTIEPAPHLAVQTGLIGPCIRWSLSLFVLCYFFLCFPFQHPFLKIYRGMHYLLLLLLHSLMLIFLVTITATIRGLGVFFCLEYSVFVLEVIMKFSLTNLGIPKTNLWKHALHLDDIFI